LRLAPRLYDLHDRGHSWREVAAWLTTQGLPVTTAVLGGYLRHSPAAAARSSPGRAKAPQARSRGGRPNAGAAPVTKRESLLAATPAKHDAAASQPSADEASVRLVHGGKAGRRSAFEVRPDTDDI
jgi:hypothetical protein